MANTDDVEQQTINDFWSNVEIIGLEKLNHAFKPRLISINLGSYLDEAIRRGLPITPLKKLRVALYKSKSPVFIEYAHVKSSLTGKNTRAFIFGRVES